MTRFSVAPEPAENRPIAVEVKGIHTVRTYLEQHGSEIREAVGMRDRERFYLLDPFGNYFEVLEMKMEAD